MMKTAFFILLAFAPYQSVIGQKKCEKMFASAIAAICKEDTVLTLQLLDKYVRDCEDAEFATSAYLLQAIIQEQTGHIDNAIKSLEIGLKQYKKASISYNKNLLFLMS